MAAFHFCMEAVIKKEQGETNVLLEIGCVESLRKLASGPNGIAAKYAAQTLRLIGEEVPHKLSQQVPTWSRYVVYTVQTGGSIWIGANLKSYCDF